MIKGNDPKGNKPQIILFPPNRIPPMFPQNLQMKGDNAKFKKFAERFSNLSIDIPLIDALQKMPGMKNS